MYPKHLLLLFLGITMLFTSLDAQIQEKDSLNNLLANTKNANKKIDLITTLLNDYEVLEADLLRYESITTSLPQNNHLSELLYLTHIIQTNYCNLGLEKNCLKTKDELIEIAEKHKTTKFKVRAYSTLARFYYDKGDSDASKKYMKLALESFKNNDIAPIYNAYYLEKSRQLRIKGKLDSSLYFIDYALTGLNEKDDFEELAIIYNGKGRIYRQLGEIDSSELYYTKALAIAEEHNLNSNRSILYNNMGNIGHIKGEYDKAIAYYMKSIQIKEKKSNTKGLCIGYHNIGAIKTDMKDYQGAIIEFEKSDILANELEFKNLNVYNALKIGESYQNLFEYDKSRASYSKALKISEEVQFKKGETAALIGLGMNHTATNEYKTAYKYLTKALELSEKTGNKSDECSALIAISEWYTKNGNTENRYNFTEIEALLLRAKKLSEEMDYGEKRLSVYEGLNKLYGQSKNYKKHSDIMTEDVAYKDTLFSTTRTQAITDWETKYATAEKEKEILQLQAEKEISELKTRSWKIALGITTFFLAIIGGFLYNYQQRKNKQKQLQEAEKFRSKLSSDLHDDVGTMLSSLAMQSEVMGLKAGAENIAKFEKLSTLSREAMSRMRDTVWAIDSRKDKVDDLLDRMKDYLADRLEGHKLKVEFNSNEVNKESKLRPDIRQNIYLIFKEAVNNAAKYSNGDKLKIVFKQNEKEIFLEVRDNGKVDPEKIQTSGLGTTNMKLRAERIGKELEIYTNNGYAVVVK